ncbi:MAG: hypothetical protein GTO02_20915 [Candidatus Dadabacteria bacterium]|nr:hypothetical protein [Candidatus Dadabacteria bacterium]
MLFKPEDETYTDEALALESEIANAITPVIGKYVERGEIIRELWLIALGGVDQALNKEAFKRYPHLNEG